MSSTPPKTDVIAVDPVSGHVYAAGDDRAMREFNASGGSPTLVSSTPIEVGGGALKGIAIDGTTGRIYVSRETTVAVYGPLVTVPDVTTGPATITSETSATLNGTVNPDGVPLEECFFEYGLTNAYGQTAPCKETPAEIGTSQKAVHADLSALGQESLYHYRLVAKNANATIQGADKTFKTPSKPGIVGAWAAEVGSAEATLKAQINPENSPTTYRFEYGLDSSYGQSTGELPLGCDNTDHIVSFGLAELAPGTTYHYRLIATNNVGESETDDQTFTTFPTLIDTPDTCANAGFRSGASAFLPDCRAFEMVSPVAKGNADVSVRINGLNYPAGLDQGAADGSAFSFSSEKSFGGSPSAP